MCALLPSPSARWVGFVWGHWCHTDVAEDTGPSLYTLGLQNLLLLLCFPVLSFSCCDT